MHAKINSSVHADLWLVLARGSLHANFLQSTMESTLLYSDFFYCIIPSCTLLLSILRLLYTLFCPVGLRLLSSYLFLHVRLLDTSLLELNLMYFTLVQVTLFDCLLYTLFHSFPLYITGGPFTMVWLTFYSYSTLLYSTFFFFFSAPLYSAQET